MNSTAVLHRARNHPVKSTSDTVVSDHNPTSSTYGPLKRGLLGIGAFLSASVVAQLSSIAPAVAHDVLLSSTPEPDQVVSEPLHAVELEFSGSGLIASESINNVIQVVDSDGENWAGNVEVDGPTATAELDDELPDGSYEVVYRVAYSDGHVEEESFDFEMRANLENPVEDAQEDQQDSGATTDEEPEPTDQAPMQEVPSDEDRTTSDEPESTSVWPVFAVIAAVLAAGVVTVLERRRARSKKADDSIREDPRP
ncbi:copper resistance protein CopC [Nesterenkonia salmonea]|uniref:Copper resistance protein CopC n=1 Tax=Nesterenkonia salmonea TaxID=1804987 RepID=A0A5R9B821_9MICC|nr:copper resistance protein CopC [Nesterenkonia salmonea]